MVKGISRQVIVVHSPDPQIFEQAIFILKDKAVTTGVTDEMLIKQAQEAVRNAQRPKRKKLSMYGPVWACGGAAVTGLVWLLTVIL